MKHLLPLLVLAAAIRVEAAQPVTTHIASVTVYADRARVHRSGDVKLAAGTADLVVSGLPGWIDEASVRAALSPAGAGRIVDVHVTRTFLARSTDEEIGKAEASVRELEDRMAELKDEERIQAARQKQIDDVKVFSMEKLPKDAAAGQAGIESYGKAVDFVAETSRDVAKRRREAARQLRDLQPDLDARQKKLADLRQRQQLEQSTIVVTIEAPAAVAAKLEVDYMTPGAAWEPAHELRASGPRPDKVEVTSYAVVSQTTGEDWTDAELFFSTQMPDEVMRLPELTAMKLDAAPAPTAVALPSSFALAKGKFEAGNAFYNYTINNADADYETNLRSQNDVQVRVVNLFAELQQKRGTTAHFPGQGRPPVRSDGRSVRIRIGQVELPSTPRIVAAPELSLSASHTVELANNGKQPLLPGPVGLFNGGAFLGTTDIPFVAEGEKFIVLMGVADRIKLARTIDRRNSSLVSGGDRKRLQVAFDVSVENLGTEPAQVLLRDRVPVSENKEVRVSSVDIEPTGKPDDKGLLAWNLTLGAGEKRAFRIAYVLEYPNRPLAPPRPTGELQRMRAMPSAAPPADMLFEQINALEQKL